MIVLILLLGVVLGLAGGYGGLVAYWRHAEVPGVHRMHDEGPRVLVQETGAFAG